MYGRQAKFTSQAGKRSEFAEILSRAAELVGKLPGCHLYMIGEDLSDESTIWVTEIWEDKAAHGASLEDEAVRSLIQEAMPLMDGRPEGVAMRVVGGYLG